MTYTLSILEVPPLVYELIRTELLAAGYTHAVDDKEGILDMTHIGLRADLKRRPNTPIDGRADVVETGKQIHEAAARGVPRKIKDTI